MTTRDGDDDDFVGKPRRPTAFDCPECNANNPIDDGFGAGDEILCFYCGTSFRVIESVGKLKLKSL
jgi:hypothetical protein